MSRADHLLEQYKLYVELMDRVSQRRQQANQFYVSLISALAGSIVIFIPEVAGKNFYALQGVAGLCIVINLLWWLTLISYRQLNKGKFEVINDLEKQLPYACFTEEWNVLGQGNKLWIYQQLSWVEGILPIALVLIGVLFLALTWLSPKLLLGI